MKTIETADLEAGEDVTQRRYGVFSVLALSSVLISMGCASKSETATPDTTGHQANLVPSVYKNLVGFSAEQRGYIQSLQDSGSSSEERADAAWNLALSDCVTGGDLALQIKAVFKHLLLHESDSAVVFRVFDAALKCHYGLLLSAADYERMLHAADFTMREKIIQFLSAIGNEETDLILLQVVKNNQEDLCLRVLAGEGIKGQSADILVEVTAVKHQKKQLEKMAEAVRDRAYCPNQPE